MESIQQTMQRLKQGKGISSQFNQLKNKVLENHSIVEFLHSHPEITEAEIEKSIARLYEFQNEQTNCQTCTSLDGCKNMMKGYKPNLYVERGKILVSYNQCDKKLIDTEKKRQQKLVKSLYIPKDILKVSFHSIEQDQSRLHAIAKAVEFVTNTKPGQSGKGLYFHGKFGVGKTFLMGAIANELAERNISSMLVYTPDFFRELKSGIHDGSYNDKIEIVKKAQVLILDDIGAETMSSWIRDDVLGVILQYRMLEKLPTLYTSNYDFKGLEEHLSYSQKGGIEVLKSKRIMERICHYAEPVYIEGKNRRDQY